MSHVSGSMFVLMFPIGVYQACQTKTEVGSECLCQGHGQGEKETRDSDRTSQLQGTLLRTLSRLHFLTLWQRVPVGMKVLGQVVAVEPLALVVSLPNQLFAHVPITQISAQLTHTLENMEDVEVNPSDSEDEDEDSSPSGVPDLSELFQPGQYVRAVVTAVHAPGATDVSGLGRARDEVQKASRRLELSLVPEKVNAGVVKTDLRSGFVRITSQSRMVIAYSHFRRLFRLLSRVLRTMAIYWTSAFQTCQVSCHSRTRRKESSGVGSCISVD